MKQTHRILVTTLAVVLVGGSSRVATAAQYTVTDLGELNSNLAGNGSLDRHGSIGLGLNDLGQAVGYSAFDYVRSPVDEHYDISMLYSTGILTPVPAAVGGRASYFGMAAGINNSGQIVGNYTTNSDALTHAYLYNGTSMLDLGNFGGTDSEALGINISGNVVGYSTTAAGNKHAFLYKNGTLTDLGILNGIASQANAINGSGQIVGTVSGSDSQPHAFLYKNGVMTDIGGLPNAIGSEALSINTSGQIVGDSVLNPTANNTGRHAFLYSNSQFTDLGSFSGQFAVAEGINNSGTVVGYSITSSSEKRAFLYKNGLLMDLNTLVDPAQVHIILHDAHTINTTGQIVGSDGLHAVLLTPNAPANLAAPTGLTSHPLSGSSLTLTWTSVAGATGYSVYRSDASGAAHAYIGSTTATSFTDTNLTTGTPYRYVVAPTVNYSQGTPSSELTATTLLVPPAGTLQLSIGLINWAYVIINWNQLPNATDYLVFRSSTPGGFHQYIGHTGSNSTVSYEDSSVSPSTTYYYIVVPSNAYGNGSKSNEASATTVAVLNAPGNVTATTVSSSQIDLHWSPVTGATKYRVSRSLTHNGTLTNLGDISGTSFSDTGLNRATTYYYVISSVNGNGVSAKSAEVSAKTLTGVPNALTNLTATPLGRSQINLSWQAAPYATGYSIFRSTASGASHSYVGAATGTSFANTGLSAGTTYFYIVVPTNSDGSGPKSAEVSAKTSTLPDAPTNVKATAISKSQINLTWTAAAGATSYIVFRGTTSGGLHSYVATTTTTSYHDLQRTPNTTYYYIIVGVNASGQGPKSAEASAKTPVN